MQWLLGNLSGNFSGKSKLDLAQAGESLQWLLGNLSGKSNHSGKRLQRLSGWGATEEPDDPIVNTADGPIRGIRRTGFEVFKGIPYVEPPVRFERSVPKRAWGPELLNATRFGPGCIGSHTDVPEDEDCLTLNVWRPEGELRDLPVIVYFHGGMNQHGSGQEPMRHGDMIVQNSGYPTIFVNFDFRLGLFGWIYGAPGSEITNNLGFYDQQEALRWVSRNIRAFGGDPSRVTLQGQSEGAGNILAHLVAPGSKGLFSRAVFHSPPADIWSRSVNMERTEFMVRKLGCNYTTSGEVLACLRELPAQKIWDADFVIEELARNPGSPSFIRNSLLINEFAVGRKPEEIPPLLGWHVVPDGDDVPGEPRKLIHEGKWNKVPVLLTVSKNESIGVFPGEEGKTTFYMLVGIGTLLEEGKVPLMTLLYNISLQETGISYPGEWGILHQMITDKMWTCDIKSLAEDMSNSGADAHVGMFWHSPKWDPVGGSTNKLCNHGATCHASEMLYVLPQGRGQGLVGFGMEEELAFSRRYSTDFLSFVHGHQGAWAPYNSSVQAITFKDMNGSRVVPGYRKGQCGVLDLSYGAALPSYYRERGAQHWMTEMVVKPQMQQAAKGWR